MNMNARFGKNNFPADNETLNHWEWVAYWRGLLEGQEEYVRAEAYKRNMGGSLNQPYVAQPVPFAISRASSNLLFGENPEVESNDEDRANYERIIKDNKLWSQSRSAAITASALAGVFAKSMIDTSTPRGRRSPIIQFIEPDKVVPVFSDSGELIEASVIIQQWDEGHGKVYRLIEHNTAETIKLTLYVGTSNAIGNSVPLKSHNKTKEMIEESPNTIEMLPIVYIPNSLTTGSNFGVSDYAHGLDNLFYTFNDAASIAHRATQAGVPYTIVPKELTDQNNNLNHEKTVLSINKLASTLGDSDINKMITTIQHNAQQDKFMNYANEVLDQILIFSGLSPQSIGRSLDGGATSGTALRLKMITSLQTAAAKAAYFEDGLNYILEVAARLDAQTFGSGSNIKKGNTWTDFNVSITLKDGLPDDEVATANIIQTLRNAGTLSIKQAVQKANPNFTDEQVNEAVDEIKSDNEQETKAIANSLPTSPALSLADALQLNDSELP
jgi:hypothetical protein